MQKLGRILMKAITFIINLRLVNRVKKLLEKFQGLLFIKMILFSLLNILKILEIKIVNLKQETHS